MTEIDIEAPTSERHTIVPALCAWAFAALVVVTSIAERALPMVPLVRVLLIATMLCGIATILAYMIRWFKARPKVTYPTLFLMALFISWAGFAGKSHDKDYLINTYVHRLLLHVNTPYQVRGETTYGMDEAGLAKASLYQAMFYEGIREVNPRLLGNALIRFWWRDLSVKDILQGSHGYTNPVGPAKQLAGYVPSFLQKGDIAITNDRRRLLVYVDDGKWVEADPAAGKIVLLSATITSRLPELNTPVMIVRWWMLDQR